jgi:membrane-bound lytic murein transglycosylase B
MKAILLITLLAFSTSASAQEVDEGYDHFIVELASESGIPAADIEAVLARAARQQSILDAISRPAEAKPWRDYRPIFLNDARVAGGLAFMRENGALLARIERETGVPASVVTAIIGIETSYGKITGSYRVVDALVTLGFHYPPRADFFRGELKQLFFLANEEESVDINQVKGSYAGAMGWGQFIPSSYRNYAVDGDGDGRRDLWNSTADIVASVANYFAEHGWTSGALVALPARRAHDARPFERDGLNLTTTLGELRSLGYHVEHEGGDDLPATLLQLEGATGDEYWIVFQNFYVISRYNRSPLYSLAVHQLSQELAASRSLETGHAAD